MIIEAFLVSVVVGFIRKGKLLNLGRVPLRHSYLFCVPFLLYGIAYGIAISIDSKSVMSYVRIADISLYVVLLAAVYLNLHVRGMWTVGAGVLSNFTVVAVNGGMMPVSAAALKAAGLAKALGSDPVRHALLTESTRLKPLADVIPVHTFSLFLSQVISVGDLLIAAGLFLLVQHYMCLPQKEPSTSG